jgi:uncharacterized protein YbjQ (UPF0145 family)
MLSNRRSMLNVPTLTNYIAPSASRPKSAYAPGALPPLTGLDNPESEPHSKISSLPTSTTTYLPGYRITKLVGTVYGIATCARKDTKSFLKLAGNGQEARSLTHMLYNARDQATERMLVDCITRGGNAIVGMNFGENEVLGFAQVSVSGTAVLVEKE